MRSSRTNAARAGLALACLTGMMTGCGNTNTSRPAEFGRTSRALCSPTPGMITLCGTAIDTSGAPLAGATANLGGTLVTTAGDGSFSVSVPAAPLVTFTVSLLGYMPVSSNIAGDILNQQFILAPLYMQTFPNLGMVNVVDPATQMGVQGLNLADLIDSHGAPGVPPITVGVHYLDPGTVPMPGDDGARDSKGQSVYLESFGMGYVEAWDARGVSLQPRTTQPTIVIPISAARSVVAPPSIPLWVQAPGSGQWQQLPATAAIRPVTQGRCEGTSGGKCGADVCSPLSGKAYVGPVSNLGFVNCDMEKTTPACLNIQVNGSLLPPGTLPLCLDIKIPLAGGGVQTRHICVGDGSNVLYNLPPNLNVDISQSTSCGGPPPPTKATVNTGAPWGGKGKPPSASLCKGTLVIPPLP